MAGSHKVDQRASPKDTPEINMTGGSENHEQPFREDVTQQDRRRQIGPGFDVGHPANLPPDEMSSSGAARKSG